MMRGNQMQVLDANGNIIAMTIEANRGGGGLGVTLLKLVCFEGRKPEAFVIKESDARALQSFLARVLE